MENIVHQHHQHQQDYYHAINQSTQVGSSSDIIEFMLKMIADAIGAGINDGINAGINMTDLDQAMLELMAANRYISNVQMAEQLRKLPSTIERHMARLKKAGVIERIGARKTGYWQIPQ